MKFSFCKHFNNNTFFFFSATPLFLSSPVITSFSGDKLYLQKIFEQWPIKLERRAVFWPPHATFIACGTAGIIIGIRVNSHTFLGDANFSYAESIKRCPKLTHGDLCNTCLLLGSITTALAGGVCLPMFSSPYLTAASAILQGDQNAIPKIRKTKNWLNYLFRWKVGINACRGMILRTVCGLAAVSGASMIMDTLSVEPEFISKISNS
ncbi:unnamed protein product [Gongylonema pulchrum]|uniref:Uncharacterized protein n=1 Tax=Gongylonema pulchrum TaxID=637853 RepID=A0A3P7RDW8_9BILA|nr:unnamed protein product [Gongylonema pulchrum]